MLNESVVQTASPRAEKLLDWFQTQERSEFVDNVLRAALALDLLGQAAEKLGLTVDLDELWDDLELIAVSTPV